VELSRRRFLQPIAGAATLPAVFRYARTQRTERQHNRLQLRQSPFARLLMRRVQRFAACLLWVKTEKARYEHMFSALPRWSQPVDAKLYLEGEMECGLMVHKFHRGFTAAEKTEYGIAGSAESR
jgi:hypothetical protein